MVIASALEAQKLPPEGGWSEAWARIGFFFVWPGLWSQFLNCSDDLQQRLAAFAVIGQDHESMPITAAVHNFICEQEVPFVQPVRHIQRLDRQFLRLADGTAPGLEHG
jgi:hypothetical protein